MLPGRPPRPHRSRLQKFTFSVTFPFEFPPISRVDPVAPAEIATLDALFDRVVPGGMIILDDYEMLFYREQKFAEDDWFGQRAYKVFPLPTCQGFVIIR